MEEISKEKQKRQKAEEKQENLQKEEQKKQEEFDKQEFGRRIREQRNKLKISSDKLGNECDVNPVFIRQIETGKKLPSISLFVKICNSLQTSPTYFLEKELSVIKDDWKELKDLLFQMSPASYQVVDEVLHSLVEGLAEKKWKRTENKKSDVLQREEFGHRLWKVRMERQLTAKEVAQSSGISSAFIRQMEAGEKFPRIPVFAKLCKTLQIAPDYLLGNQLKTEVKEYRLSQFERIECDMTLAAQKVTKDVLNVLIQNLGKDIE